MRGLRHRQRTVWLALADDEHRDDAELVEALIVMGARALAAAPLAGDRTADVARRDAERGMAIAESISAQRRANREPTRPPEKPRRARRPKARQASPGDVCAPQPPRQGNSRPEDAEDGRRLLAD